MLPRGGLGCQAERRERVRDMAINGRAAVHERVSPPLSVCSGRGIRVRGREAPNTLGRWVHKLCWRLLCLSRRPPAVRWPSLRRPLAVPRAINSVDVRLMLG